jgi:hypothetical protein
MVIEVTFELITCDSHSQEFHAVFFYLMSSLREIRLNRTLLRHSKYIFVLDCMHLTVKYEEPT